VEKKNEKYYENKILSIELDSFSSLVSEPFLSP